MKARGNDARGVAVIDDKTSESDLDAMGKAGMRGIRLNLATGGTNDPNVARKRFQAASERMQPRNGTSRSTRTSRSFRGSRTSWQFRPVPVVFDHFGGAQAALGVDQPGFTICWDS